MNRRRFPRKETRRSWIKKAGVLVPASFAILEGLLEDAEGITPQQRAVIFSRRPPQPVVSGGAWTPLNLSPKLWFKADSLSKSDGDAVTYNEWTDQSGNGLAFSSGNGTVNYRANGPATGKPALQSSTNNAKFLMSAANFGSALDRPFTISTVFKFNSTANAVICDGPAVNKYVQIECYGLNIAFFTGGAEPVISSANTNWHKLLITSELTSANSTFQLDGGSKTVFSSDPGGRSLEGLTLFNTYNHFYTTSVWIAEFFVSSGSIGDSDRTSANSYFNTRYGL